MNWQTYQFLTATDLNDISFVTAYIVIADVATLELKGRINWSLMLYPLSIRSQLEINIMQNSKNYDSSLDKSGKYIHWETFQRYVKTVLING